MTIGLSQLSKLLGITERRINQLVEEGVLSKIERGKYDLGKCIQAYIAYKDRQIEQLQLGGEEKRNAEERKARAQADMLELDLAERRKQLIKLDDLIKVLEPVMVEIRGRMLGIPKRAARELQNKEIEHWLDEQVHKTLEALSSIPDRLERHRAPADADDPAAAQPAQAAAKAHRKSVGRRASRPQPRGQRRKRPVGNRKG